MAREEDEEQKKEEPSGGGKKKMIIIIAVVLVLVLGGAGAFFALGKKKPAEGEEGAEEGGEEHAEGEEGAEGEHGELPGAVFPLETFIVNLQVKGSFLKATLQLEFATPEPPKGMGNDVPKIRDGIIRVLSSKSAQDILTPDGKEKLRNEVKDVANKALGSEEIVQVYFTEFIVQ